MLALAERWNGSRWSILPTASLPSGATGAQLEGISCTSTRACTAVGTVSRGKIPNDWPLVERWDGRRWLVQTAPKPAGASGRIFSVELSGVSCASGTACIAIGSYSSETLAGAAFTESWDGSRWTILKTPNPGVPGASLTGISCSSPRTCVAVGTTSDRSGYSIPLAERWDGARWGVEYPPQPAVAASALVMLDAVSCPSGSDCTAVGHWQYVPGSAPDWRSAQASNDEAFVDRWSAAR